MDILTLYLDFFLGLVGLAFLAYARKQQHPMAFLSGMALGIFPFFVSNFWVTLLVGVALIAAPFMIEI